MSSVGHKYTCVNECFMNKILQEVLDDNSLFEEFLNETSNKDFDKTPNKKFNFKELSNFFENKNKKQKLK
jgi:hypothetical protein